METKRCADLEVNKTYTVIDYGDQKKNTYGIYYIIQIVDVDLVKDDDEIDEKDIIRMFTTKSLAKHITENPNEEFRFTVKENNDRKYAVIEGTEINVVKTFQELETNKTYCVKGSRDPKETPFGTQYILKIVDVNHLKDGGNYDKENILEVRSTKSLAKHITENPNEEFRFTVKKNDDYKIPFIENKKVKRRLKKKVEEKK